MLHMYWMLIKLSPKTYLKSYCKSVLTGREYYSPVKLVGMLTMCIEHPTQTDTLRW